MVKLLVRDKESIQEAGAERRSKRNRMLAARR